MGLNGKKAAKDYLSVERGANKVNYSRRKAFWDTVLKLMQRGHTSDSAIDRFSNI